MLLKQDFTRDTLQVQNHHTTTMAMSAAILACKRVIIGYMAGSLTNGSTNFNAMLGAGLTCCFINCYHSSLHELYCLIGTSHKGMAQGLWATDLGQAILINFVPSIALGVIVPILAKVMTWYGLQPMKH